MKTIAGKRYYDRIWTDHVRPAYENSPGTLTAIVESLPVSVAPMEGRGALYQAMARRANGLLKKPTKEGALP